MSADPQTPKPLLFISHKHSDKAIADVIRSFVSIYSGGRVDVFQTSSAQAKTTESGANVKRELRKTLMRASVVILVYTAANENWNYCMWECGVADHPRTPEGLDTKTILFQCTTETPALFLETVNVNVRDLVHIQKFTSEFLTAEDFFPELGGPVTRFHSDGPEVAAAAADFYQKLQPVLPPEKVDAAEEWPAFPFLQFEVNFEDVEILKEALKSGPKDRTNAYGIVQEKCVISDADNYAKQLFGVPGFPSGMNLKQLADSWLETYSNSQSEWVQSLCSQITDGANWKFPKPKWKLMQGVNDEDSWYAPVLNRVRRIPARKSIQFDVYFYRLNVDTEAQSVVIKLPPQTQE